MRRRLAQVGVFVCVFALFRGYCEWWRAREQPKPAVNAQSPPDCGAYAVRGAADETFNGIYLPIAAHEGGPCYATEEPRRYLWRSACRWHLSSEPGALADGYMGTLNAPATGQWSIDGAPAPAPRVEEVQVAEPGG